MEKPLKQQTIPDHHSRQQISFNLPNSILTPTLYKSLKIGPATVYIFPGMLVLRFLSVLPCPS
jgi:hypothetical protein